MEKRKVLITGAQGGLGQYVASAFVRSGDSVTGVSFQSSSGDFFDPEVKSQIHWVQADLTQPREVEKLCSKTSFDVLIHAAGGFRYSKVEELGDADLNFLLDTNLRSAFYLTRSLIPSMKKNNYGRIIFVSSEATFAPPAGMSAYTASKAGLNMLTLSLAKEVKPFNITVNAVLPSIIDTAANRRDIPHAKFSDWVTPTEVSSIIHTLCSPLGKPIHGALIPISGRV